MSWTIQCSDRRCGKETWSQNIVDLLEHHRDKEGWFIGDCGHRGYIQKSYKLQERDGDPFEPRLFGALTLGRSGEVYQPFVFLVGYEGVAGVKDVWFSYYKDLRGRRGGQLKVGMGPGGPPILAKLWLANVLAKLVDMKCVTKGEVLKELEG